MRLGAGFLFLWLALAPAATAQTVGPPGPYVVDLHGTMAGLPSGGDFLPPVPSATVIPARGFGFDVGGQVYPLGLGRVRIGFGVSALRARGTASPPTVAATTTTGTTSSGTTPPMPTPGVATTFSGWAPQVSLNFGDRDGWSYLSAGVGPTRMRTVATSSASAEQRTTGHIQTINVGGGARWFTNPHLAAGFDVRFYKLASTTSSVPGPATTVVNGAVMPAPPSTVTVTTPHTTLMVISVGVSVR